MTESSGKSSNAGHPARVRSPRAHAQVAEERERTAAGRAHDDGLVAGRMPAGGHGGHAGEQLLLALGPALGAPVADEPQFRLDVTRHEPRIVAERDFPLGPLRHDAGPREGARAIGPQQAAGVVEMEVAHRNNVDGLAVRSRRSRGRRRSTGPRRPAWRGSSRPAGPRSPSQQGRARPVSRSAGS